MKPFKALIAASTIAAVVALAGAAHAASFKPYSTSAFNKALASGKTVIVHVHAKWCSACVRQERPLHTELSKPAYSKIGAYRVNFDKDRDFLRKYRVNTQTTIMIFKRGKLTTKSVGVTNPNGVAKIVRKAL